eukprot:359819-Chlamydomonas_euryale.AAC.3
MSGLCGPDSVYRGCRLGKRMAHPAGVKPAGGCVVDKTKRQQGVTERSSCASFEEGCGQRGARGVAVGRRKGVGKEEREVLRSEGGSGARRGVSRPSGRKECGQERERGYQGVEEARPGEAVGSTWEG